MKGIIIKSGKEEYKLEFKKGFLVIEEKIEEPNEDVKKSKVKVGDVLPGGGNKYEAYLTKNGKKGYRLKKGMKRAIKKTTAKSRREASLRAWETKRRNAEAKKTVGSQIDRYEGLVKLNQLEKNE